MQRQKSTMTTFMLFVGCLMANAQDLSEVMSKVMDVYATTDSYHTTMDYILYSNGESNVVKDELKGEVIKEGENYYTKMKETEMIFTNEFMLKISHPEKNNTVFKIEDFNQ